MAQKLFSVSGSVRANDSLLGGETGDWPSDDAADVTPLTIGLGDDAGSPVTLTNDGLPMPMVLSTRSPALPDTAPAAGDASPLPAMAAASVPGLSIIDVIPFADSAETNQNSEPSIAVDPADATKIIVGAFYPGSVAAYFKSTDGGTTWADDALLTSYDKTLAWTQDGSTCLTASLNDLQNIYLYSGSTGTNFTTQFTAVGGGSFNIDQPWLRTGPANHLYLTFNYFGQQPKTAWVAVSADGGAHLTFSLLDRVGGAGDDPQDAPSVRTAVSGNTVYSAFTRWNARVENDADGERFASQVVIVRSDNAGADGFTALGAGGNGVQVAAPIAGITGTQSNPYINTPLTLGQNRVGSDLAIAVDPNNAQRVFVAYDNEPGANHSGQMQLIVAESNDGGASWTDKYTSDSATRTALPGLTILSNGTVGLLDCNYNPTTDMLSQHLLITTNDFSSTSDILLATERNSTPLGTVSPYLGDFYDLTSVGNTFYGIFSASNANDGTNAQFSSTNFLRNHTGTPGTGNFRLTDTIGNTVPFSIDPFFFSYSPQSPPPPHVAPTINVQNISVGENTSIPASSMIVSVSNPSGDTITAYEFKDLGAGNGHFVVNGVSQPDNQWIEVLTGNLGTIQYVGGPLPGAETLEVEVYDYTTNSYSVPGIVTATTTSPPSPPPPSPPPPSPPPPSPPPSPPPLPPSDHNGAPLADFNGDGTSDILFQNSTTGQLALWSLQNGAVQSIKVIGSVPSTVQFAATGDFNGDHSPDLLLRDTANGQIVVWDMINGALQSINVLGSAPSSYQIAGIGDFNGDGTSDILFRDSGGNIASWTIQNNLPQSISVLGSTSASYRIVGLFDINHDGTSDILFRNDNGQLAFWAIKNNQLFGQPQVLGSTSTDWHLVGTGDFLGNGNTDLLFRNDNGALAEWLFNGTQLQSATVIGVADLSYHVEGTGDFNHDGKSDILFRNDAGQMVEWLMNGSQLLSAQILGSTSPQFNIATHHFDVI